MRESIYITETVFLHLMDIVRDVLSLVRKAGFEDQEPTLYMDPKSRFVIRWQSAIKHRAVWVFVGKDNMAIMRSDGANLVVLSTHEELIENLTWVFESVEKKED